MAAGAMEQVVIILEAITSRFNKNMDEAKKNMSAFNKVMLAPIDRFRKLTTQAGKANKRFREMKSPLGQVAHGIRMATHGLRQFNMQALGVMFFGMMLQRTFMGLLNPVMETYGVFDLFREMLTVLFIPVMDLLFPILLGIMDWFMNMPGPVKLIIGIITAVGAAFGTFLFYVGAITLGLGQLIGFLPNLIKIFLPVYKFFLTIGTLITSIVKVVIAKAIMPLISAFLGLSAPIVAAIAAIIAIFIGMYLAWKENFKNMKLVVEKIFEGIKKVINGAILIFKAQFGFILGFFTGDFKKMKTAADKIFTGIVKIVDGVIQTILNSFKAMMIGVAKIFVGAKDWGTSMVKKLVEGITGVGSKVKDALLKLFPEWARTAIWKAGNFIVSIGEKAKVTVTKTTTGGKGLLGRAFEGIKKIFSPKTDFIWRAGSGAMPFSPDDTVVGTKGGANGGGTIINNFNGFTMDELRRELDNRDRQIVADIRRIVKT